MTGLASHRSNLTLPPETWSLIFHFLLPEEHSALTPLAAIQASPFLPLRICRSWSVIARTDPSLWTQLNLHLPSSETAHRVSHVIRLCFAQRSVARTMRDEREREEYLGLKLTISCAQTSEDPEIIPNIPLLSVIPYRERLTHLTLQLPPIQYRCLWFLPAGSFPRLEHLELSVEESHGRFPPDSEHFPPRGLQLMGIRNALRLRVLRLDVRCQMQVVHAPWDRFRGGPWRPSITGIQWDTFTELKLISVPILTLEILDLLRESRNLVIGRFSVLYEPIHADRAEADRILLPRLETLQISCAGKASWQVFRYLSLPCLGELDVSDYSDWSSTSMGILGNHIITGFSIREPIEDLRQALSASSSPLRLRILCIRTVSPFRPEDVLTQMWTLLQPLQSLKVLLLHIPDLNTKAFLNRLIVRKNTPKTLLLPSLTRLFMGGAHSDATAVPLPGHAPEFPARGIVFDKVKNILIKMIHSRRKLALQAVYLETRTPVNREDGKNFQDSLVQNKDGRSTKNRVWVGTTQYKTSWRGPFVDFESSVEVGRRWAGHRPTKVLGILQEIL